MKWEMETEDVESMLEKIWDLHDKLSDAILSISRAHYLTSIKSLRLSGDVFLPRKMSNNLPGDGVSVDSAVGDGKSRAGCVFVKEYRVAGVDEEDYYSAIREAKSLNGIRSALENLEDQLEFFHMVQVQQRAERETAIACLEQSCIFLARRLSEHRGKNYKVIEEALAFVGDAGHSVSTSNLYASAFKKSTSHKRNSFNLIQVLANCFNFTKKNLKITKTGGVLGNAALVAFGLLALLHLHRMSFEDKYVLGVPRKKGNTFYNRSTRSYPSEDSPSERLARLDVTLARG